MVLQSTQLSNDLPLTGIELTPFRNSASKVAGCGISMIDFFSPLRAKDVYMRPPCTLDTATVHAFRAHQGRICASLTVGKKLLGTQTVLNSKILITLTYSQ